MYTSGTVSMCEDHVALAHHHDDENAAAAAAAVIADGPRMLVLSSYCGDTTIT